MDGNYLFICDRCQKEFTSPIKYSNHLKRIKPCRKNGLNKNQKKEKKINKREYNKGEFALYEDYTKPIDGLFNEFSESDINENFMILLCNIIQTSKENKNDNAEVSTPYELLNKMCKRLNKNILTELPKILDYSCGKGNIILALFVTYYTFLKSQNEKKDNSDICQIVLNNLYFADINELNVIITRYKLLKLCEKLTKKSYDYHMNYWIGDSMKLNIEEEWKINSFDVIFVNPPFENKSERNTTPHKLWIDFTLKTFKDWLKPNGLLYQISPSSFSSPSSKILSLFREKNVKEIHFNQKEYFKDVSISIAWYIIQNNDELHETNINDKFSIIIDDNIIYIPNDITNVISLSIHNKVMLNDSEKIKLEKDYVTCHNIRLKEEDSPLSKDKTETHIYPVFHTNKQIWYSSIKQGFLEDKKVMFTRSGYTKPFYDNGNYGITDLGYYISVSDDNEGENLSHNLNNEVFTYIFKTARWSGFGNEKVFSNIPKLPNKNYSNDELYDYFKLTKDEIAYIKDNL